MKVKIGNTVIAKDLAGNRLSGVVSKIEICSTGSISGRPVKSVETTKHNNGVIKFGDSWCYFYQLISVDKANKINN